MVLSPHRGGIRLVSFGSSAGVARTVEGCAHRSRPTYAAANVGHPSLPGNGLFRDTGTNTRPFEETVSSGAREPTRRGENLVFCFFCGGFYFRVIEGAGDGEAVGG